MIELSFLWGKMSLNYLMLESQLVITKKSLNNTMIIVKNIFIAYNKLYK